ncbi:MAG: mannose-6-phosphate isomerase, class I [Candidatus Omnitrophica bacterium]|nr:mannose-6-phosphate isomerase, class I [Candidatus Omnitrophota bacterium]
MKLFNRIISLFLSITFTFDSSGYGLATLPSSQNIDSKQEISAVLLRKYVEHADPAEMKEWFEHNGTECILLNCGKYLIMDSDIVNNALKLLKVTAREDAKALVNKMFIDEEMEKLEDPEGYSGNVDKIRKAFLEEFHFEASPGAGVDAFLEKIMVDALEWIFLLEDKVIRLSDVPRDSQDIVHNALKAMERTRDIFEKSGFLELSSRKEKIREAIEKGMRFYRIPVGKALEDGRLSMLVPAADVEKETGILSPIELASREASPVLWRELGISREKYFKELPGIMRLAAEMYEIAKNEPDTHFYVLLRKIRARYADRYYLPEAIKWISAIDQLTARIDNASRAAELDEKDKDNKDYLFPLDNPAYRALIEMVRLWPKKDPHTHISNSISEEKILTDLIELQNKGRADVLLRIKLWLEKDADMSQAKKKMKALLFPDGVNARDFESIPLAKFLEVYDDIHTRGVRDLRDIIVDNMPPAEAEAYFLDSIENVARQSFSDGVREVELRFNPFKEMLYTDPLTGAKADIGSYGIILDDLLRKLDDRLSKLEAEADKVFGKDKGPHRVVFMFSIGRDRLEGDRFVKGEWERKFAILSDLKEKYGFAAFYGERLSGVDIAGIEPFGKEQGDTRETISERVRERFHLDQMAVILKRLKDAGYAITTHLGCRYGSSPRDDVMGHAAFVKAHLDAWGDVLDRVGHGKIFTTGKVYSESVDGADSKWAAYDEATAKALVKELRMKGIAIETCPQKLESRSVYRMMRDLPNVSWIEKGVKVVYGTDGSYLSGGCTLSQWITRLMLSFPASGRKYFGTGDMMETVSSVKKSADIEENINKYSAAAWEHFYKADREGTGTALLVTPNEFLRKTIALSGGLLEIKDPYYMRMVCRRVEEIREKNSAGLLNELSVSTGQMREQVSERARGYLEKGERKFTAEQILKDYERVINNLFILQSALMYPKAMLWIFQSLYREMEEFRLKSESEKKETPFLILISATDRIESLRNFFQSLVEEVDTFNYGLTLELGGDGSIVKRTDKVTVAIIENSSDPLVAVQNRELIAEYRNKGLRIVYYGADEKVKIVEMIRKREGEKSLYYRFGITPEDLGRDKVKAVTAGIKNAGYNATRNFSFEVARECFSTMPDDSVSVLIDDDEMLNSLLVSDEEGVKIERPFSFFHNADRYYKDPVLEVLSGNISGDPAIGVAEMLHGNLRDLKEFLERTALMAPGDDYTRKMFEGASQELSENVMIENFNDYGQRATWSGKSPMRRGWAFPRVPREGEERTVGAQFRAFADAADQMFFGHQETRPIGYSPDSYMTDSDNAVVPKMVWSFFGTGGNLMLSKKLINYADMTCMPTGKWRREDVMLEKLIEVFYTPVNMTFLPVRHSRLKTGHRMGITRRDTGELSFVRFLGSAYHGYIFQRFVERIFDLEYIGSMEDFIRVATKASLGEYPGFMEWYLSVKKRRYENLKQYLSDLKDMALEMRAKGFFTEKKYWWNNDPSYAQSVREMEIIVDSIIADMDPAGKDYSEMFAELHKKTEDTTLADERKVVDEMRESYPHMRNYMREHPYSYTDLKRTEEILYRRSAKAGVRTVQVTIMNEAGRMERIRLPLHLRGASRLISVYIASSVYNFLVRNGAGEKIYIACDDEQEARGVVKRVKKTLEISGLDFTVRGNYNVKLVPARRRDLAGIREEERTRERERGRILKNRKLKAPEKGVFMCLDLGKSSAKILVHDGNAVVYSGKKEGSFYYKRTPGDIKREIGVIVDETLTALGYGRDSLRGVTVLVPDIVDKAGNKALYLKGEDLPFPAIVRHDSEGHAAYFRNKGLDNFYLLALGTHPGTQAVIFGKTADEPMEMSRSVVCIDGREKPVELRELLSTQAVLEEGLFKGIIDHADNERKDEAFAIMAQKAEEGDERALSLLNYLGEYTAIHLVNMVRHIRFDKVVFSGGMCRGKFGEMLAENTMRSLKTRGFGWIKPVLMGDEDMQLAGALGGISLAEEYWIGPDEDARRLKVYHKMILSLKDDGDASKWKDVFDRFKEESGAKPGDFEKVRMCFERDGGKYNEFIFHLPLKMAGAEREIAARYLSSWINKFIVSRAAKKVVIDTAIEGMFKEIETSFDAEYNDPNSQVSLARTVGEYWDSGSFRLEQYAQGTDLDIEPYIMEKETALKRDTAINRSVKAIGINVGKYRIKISVVEIMGQGRYKHIGKIKDFNTWEKTDDRSSFDTLYTKLIKGVREVLAENGLSESDVDGIGIAAATAVKNGQPLGRPMGFARGFNREAELAKLKGLRAKMSEDLSGLPVFVRHDGDVECLGMARSKGIRNLLVMKCGNTPGVGFVENDGNLAEGLNEFGKVVTDMGRDALAHDKTGVKGEVASYTAWDGTCKVAKKMGLYEKYNFGPEDPVPGILQGWLNLRTDSTFSEREDARKVFLQSGRETGKFVVEMLDLYPIEHIGVSGGVYFGESGKAMKAGIEEIFKESGLLGKINIIIDNYDMEKMKYNVTLGGAYLVYDAVTLGDGEIKAKDLDHASRLFGISPRILKLKARIAEWKWGGRTRTDGRPSAIRELLGESASDEPAAEAWYGAHPKLPSPVEIFGLDTTLDKVMERVYEVVLGPEVVKRFGKVMPIMFKFLDAAESLSIQCHPGKEQARRLARERPGVYDEFNKPEAFVACTDEGFSSLGGVLPIDDFIKVLKSHFPDIETDYAAEKDKAGYDPALFVKKYVKLVLDKGNGFADIVMPELLNQYNAKNGEVLYSHDGHVNALLSGFIAEIETNSDNTLRAAKTVKERDIPNFLEAADLTPAREELRKFRETDDPAVKSCITTEAFALDLVSPGENGEVVVKTRDSFHLLVVFKGSVIIRGPDGRDIKLERGEACLIPAFFEEFRILSEGGAEVFDSFVPVMARKGINRLSVSRMPEEAHAGSPEGQSNEKSEIMEIGNCFEIGKTGNMRYDKAMSEACYEMRERRYISGEQWKKAVGSGGVSIEIVPGLDNRLSDIVEKEGKKVILINKDVMDSDRISDEDLRVILMFVLSSAIDRITFGLFAEDIRLLVPSGESEVMILLRDMERLWYNGRGGENDRNIFLNIVRRLDTNYSFLYYNTSYALLAEGFEAYKVNPQGRPGWLKLIKKYIEDNAGDGKTYKYDVYDREVASFKASDFFALRRWFRGYYFYWANAVDERDPGTGINFIFDRAQDPEFPLTPHSAIIQALKQPVESRETARAMGDKDDGKKRTFLEDTLLALHDWDDIDMERIDRVYIRYLKSGTFKEVYYVQVILKDDFAKPLEFALLVPRETVLRAGYDICISPWEIDKLEELNKHDSALVPKPGSRVTTLSFHDEGKKPFWQRRDMYSMQYAGRDTVGLLDLYDLEDDSKIQVLRDVVSKYIILWHRNGGYEFICDPTNENVCFLDWDGRIVDMGAPTYDYDIVFIMRYLWERICFDSDGRSLFSYGKDRDEGKERIPDRSFIFDGVVDAFVQSRKGEEVEEAVTAGIRFLQRVRNYPSVELPEEFKEALDEYLAKYGTKKLDYKIPERIEYKPLSEVNWDVVDKLWRETVPDKGFQPNAVSYFDFLGVNYMAKSFMRAIATRGFPLPDVNFTVQDLIPEQENAILEHMEFRFKRDMITPDRLTLLFLKSLALKYEGSGGENIIELGINNSDQYLRIIKKLQKIAGGRFTMKGERKGLRDKAGLEKILGISKLNTIENILTGANPKVIVIDDKIWSSLSGDGLKEAFTILNDLLGKERRVVITSEHSIGSLLNRYVKGTGLKKEMYDKLSFIARNGKEFSRYAKGENGDPGTWSVEEGIGFGSAEIMAKISMETGLPLWSFLCIGDKWSVPMASLPGTAGIAVEGGKIFYFMPGDINVTTEVADNGLLRVLRLLDSALDIAGPLSSSSSYVAKVLKYSLPASFETQKEFEGYDDLIRHTADKIETKHTELEDAKMFVSMSGMVGAGKSTVSSRVVEELERRGKKVIYLGEDEVVISRAIRREWEVRLDPKLNDFYAYHDWDKLRAIIGWLKSTGNGKKTFDGLYNNKTGECDGRREFDIDEDTIIIFEGIYPEDTDIYPKELFNLRFHFTIPFDTSLERDVARVLERSDRTEMEARVKSKALWGTLTGLFLKCRDMIKRGDCEIIDMSDLMAPRLIRYKSTAMGGPRMRKRNPKITLPEGFSDTEPSVVLKKDVLKEYLDDKRSYRIRYDTARLSLSQQKILETYASVMGRDIKLAPYIGRDGSMEPLVTVFAEGTDGFKGEASVEVKVPEGSIGEYFLRITGILNIAMAASNLEAGKGATVGSEMSNGPIMGFIREQYRKITGRDPDADGVMYDVSNMKIELPESYKMSMALIEEFNELASKALVAA